MTSHRWLRRTAIGFVLLLALVVAVLVVISTPWFKNELREIVVERSAAALNGELSIGRISGSLFYDVTLHDVVLAQDGEATIAAASIAARYDPVQLIAGRLSFDELVVRGLRMRLIQSDEGWNVTRLLRTREESTSAPRAISIGRIEVTDGAVRIEPLGQPPLDTTNVALEGSFASTPPETRITIDNGRLTERETGLDVTELAARLMLAEGGFAAEDVTVVATGLRLAGRAARPAGAAPELDVRAVFSDFALAPFARYVPERVPRQLVASGDATLRGRFNALAAGWSLRTNVGATDGQVTLDLEGRPMRVQGNASVANLDLDAVLQRPDLSGRVTGNAVVDAAFGGDSPADLRATFAASAGPVRVLTYRLDALESRGEYRDGVLSAKGQGRAYGARATFDARVDPAAGGAPLQVHAAGQVAGLDLRRLPPSLNAPAIESDIDTGYVFDMRGTRWTAELRPGESLVGGATIEDGTIITAESDGRSIAASLDGVVENVPGELLRLPATRPTVLGGAITANVRIADRSHVSDLNGLTASVQANLTAPTVQGTKLDRAVIDAAVDAGRLDLRALDVAAPGVLLEASGDFALTEEASAAEGITYVMDVDDLARLPVGVEALRGSARVEGTLTGSLEQLRTSGKLAARQVGYATSVEALVLDGTFDVSLPTSEPGRVVADVKTESTFLEVQGRELDRVTLTGRYEGGQLAVQGRIEERTRALDFDGDLVLHPDHREVHLRQFTLAGPGAPWQLGAGEARILYHPDRVMVDNLVLTRGPERLAAEGTIALAEGGTSTFLARLEALQVGDLYTLATGEARVTGTADGQVALSGNLKAPVVDANIGLINGQVVDLAYAQIGAEVQLRGGVATVNARAIEPAGTTLTVAGTVPVSDPAGPIELAVASSSIGLGLVQAFTTHVENVQGTASIDLKVTGTRQAPLINGTLQVRDGAFLLAATAVPYESFNADVAFTGRSATINQFSIADDDQMVLTLTGQGDLFAENGTRALDVSIKSSGFQILGGDLGDIEVTADARAHGTLAAPIVSGKVFVDQGVIEVDRMLEKLTSGSSAPVEPVEPEDPSVAAAAAAPAAGEVPAPPPPDAPVERATPAPDAGVFSRAAISLDLIVPDDMVLRGRDIRTGAGTIGLGDMNLTVGGEIELRKEAGSTLIVLGEVRTVRGFYDFQGRRFEVTRGSTIRFRGVQPINPALDITGEREVSGITAIVQVRGTARQPELELSSQPPLDQGDVLALIVFNQPISQLGEGEQVTLLERAGDLAAGALATTLTESISGALDVDLFQIRAPTSGEAGEVQVGQQVNDRLFVGVRQQFGESDATRLSFEYRLTEALRVLTSVAQGVETRRGSARTERAGVDLVFTIRY